uniref:Holliday junction resolvase MOC1, chloroplastic n=1 Tax=Erigeron canadensis TaxID=72917 RepID=UPI001CB8D2AA|nr:Holliday junction resolvase MOC1, chloroplastic [Erigeron canadensis]
MGSLQYNQTSIMSPIPFSCNTIKTAATTIKSSCFRAIVSKYFCTSSPKVKAVKPAISKVSADELKQQWLNSLTCVPKTESLMLQHEDDENCGNGGVVFNNAGSPWVIGVDPDVSGALAVLKTDDFGFSAQVYDSPNVKVLVGNRIRRRMDTKAMVQLLRSLDIPIGTTAYIEQSLPYPGDGKQGWWSGGFNYGLWIGVLLASEVSVVPVPSARWKQEFKLSGNGKTKDDSRALACTLFPMLSSSLKRKKDHGRAEALLIAAYGKGIKLSSDLTSISESSTPTDRENTI